MTLRRPLLGCLAALALLALSGRPAGAAALKAGTLATLRWEGFGAVPPAHAEEWEVFLSIDGGRTYPLRITPHLDLAVRGFVFQIPDLPTQDARLLLRLGDERNEVEVESPWTFAILPGRSSSTRPRDVAFSRGESPRPHDPGVVFWVEGGRDGSGLRELAATAPPSTLRSVGTGRLPWLLLLGPSRGAATALRAAPVEAVRTFASRPDAADESPAPPSPPSVRLLIHRFNE